MIVFISFTSKKIIRNNKTQNTTTGNVGTIKYSPLILAMIKPEKRSKNSNPDIKTNNLYKYFIIYTYYNIFVK